MAFRLDIAYSQRRSERAFLNLDQVVRGFLQALIISNLAKRSVMFLEEFDNTIAILFWHLNTNK